MIAFGPVPSRRLGRSLGINNIPPKVCSYACVYCQVGSTARMQVERHEFYEPERILQDVENKVANAQKAGEHIDYLTFVPDGEPTLDINLSCEIRMLKQLGIPIAIITNNTLLSRQDVRDALMEADWVSLKVDAVEEKIWQRINRPHGHLQLTSILDGALAFARSYKGKLVTETMLVAGVNDSVKHMHKIANFLGELQPNTAYLSTVTRPPVERWVYSPDEKNLNQAFQILATQVKHVEYLIGYEGNAFSFTGNVIDDLLSITAVHPMRKDAVDKFLDTAQTNWLPIRQLIAQKQLLETEYGGHTYYVRIPRKPPTDSTD